LPTLTRRQLFDAFNSFLSSSDIVGHGFQVFSYGKSVIVLTDKHVSGGFRTVSLTTDVFYFDNERWRGRGRSISGRVRNEIIATPRARDKIPGTVGKGKGIGTKIVWIRRAKERLDSVD